MPEAASVAIRELIPDSEGEALAAPFFQWAADRDVALQYILYSVEDTQRLLDLVQRGIVADSRPHALFVLGRYSASQRSTPTDLLGFLRHWPQNWPWSLCAFGDTEARCAAAAVALGGHVRVGFENNLLRPDREAASDNSEQVANVQVLATCCGRSLADIGYAREIYGVASTATAISPAPS